MRAQGHGEPPCAYAVAVLGSAGRGESLPALDQDNAIVFADGAPGSTQDQWFEALGVHLPISCTRSAFRTASAG
jgi:CBS domain-containing protein